MDWDFACTLRRLTLGLLLAGFGSIALAQGQGYWGGAAGLAAAVGLAILVVLAVVVLGLAVLTYRWGGARALMVFVALVVGILVAGKLDHYLTTERSADRRGLRRRTAMYRVRWRADHGPRGT